MKSELKTLLMQNMVEKGEYDKLAKYISDEDGKETSTKIVKLMEPISAFADMLTENTKGVMMEGLTELLKDATDTNSKELTQSIEEAKKNLEDEVTSLLATTKDSLTTEHLTRYKEAEDKLQSELMQMCIEIVSAKADEILPTLSSEAKLTEDEIEEIIFQSALSVESQMAQIVGDYVSTASFTVSQIADFRDKVIELIPQIDPSKFSIDWTQVRNTPSVGGTNANLVKQIVDEAIAAIESLPDQTGNSGKFLTTNGTVASWGVPAGSGDVIKVGTPVNNQVGVWTGDGTIEGTADLTFDGTTFDAPNVTVDDEVYGVGWNGSTEVPTKNALYDKIETIAAGGITRSITSIAAPTTAGASAATDYVYFITNTTLTLPTAVSNTNRYTVKCISGTCVVDGDGAETIDGTANIGIQVEDSVDLISNNTEWKVI